VARDTADQYKCIAALLEVRPELVETFDHPKASLSVSKSF